MRPLTQKNTPKQSRSNVKLYTVTGWCSTRTLLLICSSCKKENGHPLSLSTPQINPAKLITTAAGGFFAKHYEKKCLSNWIIFLDVKIVRVNEATTFVQPSPRKVYEGQMCGKYMYGSRTYPGVIILPTPAMHFCEEKSLKITTSSCEERTHLTRVE